MVRVCVLTTETNVRSKETDEKILKYIFDNGVGSIRVDQVILLEHMNELVDLIGKEYTDKILCDSRRCKPGRIIIFNKNSDKSQEFHWIKYRVENVDTTELDTIIAMESPKYLIMNSGTLQTLMNQRYDDIDKYNLNDSAFYHSYRKIPIALSEFVDLGKIDVIESEKARK